jgi:hypothetical protein
MQAGQTIFLSEGYTHQKRLAPICKPFYDVLQHEVKHKKRATSI